MKKMWLLVIFVAMMFSISCSAAGQADPSFTAEYWENQEYIRGLRAEDGNCVGVFIIDDIDLKVPIYECFVEWYNADAMAQYYTDCRNSAALFNGWTPYMVLADHVNQSFERLNEVEVGTTARIEWYNNSYNHFKCIEVEEGIDDRTKLIDQYGTSWHYWDCDLATYTCIVGSSNGVFIAKWDYDD